MESGSVHFQMNGWEQSMNNKGHIRQTASGVYNQSESLWGAPSWLKLKMERNFSFARDLRRLEHKKGLNKLV